MPLGELHRLVARQVGNRERVALGTSVVEFHVHDEQLREGWQVSPSGGAGADGRNGNVIDHGDRSDGASLLGEPPALSQIRGEKTLKFPTGDPGE